MSFLDKFKKGAGTASQTASSLANTAISKSKTAASITRVKLAIASEEDKLKKAYTEMGRLFYRDYEAQADADMVEYTPWCEKAADAKANILRLTEELTALKAELHPETPAKPAETEAPSEEAPAEEAEAPVEEAPAEEAEAPAEEAPAAEEPEDTSIFADTENN